MEITADNCFLAQDLQTDRVKGVPIIPSDSLFNQQDEVVIVHQGEQYRLRRTRNGKLILTK
jgi:hemin uptake protein HemP